MLGTPDERRSKPLHRTMPCWSRRLTENGKVQYSLLVPHRLGGGVQTIDTFAPETPRIEVARLLRERRRMLWGRSKDAEGSEEPQVAPKKPRARKAAVAILQADSAAPADTREVAGTQMDDRPPWDEEAENQRAFAAEANAALEAAILGSLPPDLAVTDQAEQPAAEDSTEAYSACPAQPDSIALPNLIEGYPPHPTIEPDGQMGFAF